MNVLSDDQKSVTLIPSILALNQTLDMTLYVITDYKLENSTSGNAGIRMKIRMKRKILSEMMTTYFPSLLLMMITYATTFFKPFFFEAALSVNLTTMLMMTTILIGKMQTLPATAYIRMIDVWLVFCQLVPFAEVILITAQEYYRDEEDTVSDKVEENKPVSGIFVKNSETDEPVELDGEKVLGGNKASIAGEQHGMSPSKKIATLKIIGRNYQRKMSN